jgi:uncharacterized protein (DUF927 family)
MRGFQRVFGCIKFLDFVLLNKMQKHWNKEINKLFKRKHPYKYHICEKIQLCHLPLKPCP